jgi:glycosyltransferase involved in cell wall biosynthesis
MILNSLEDSCSSRNQLLVSIIVPTYNRAHLIKRALESIFRQTYANLELIIIDDGSTDDTEFVIAAYTNKSYFPVRYYKKNNGGCASARNMGVSLATGDALAFLDSDDELLPNAIGELVRTMEETGADFVYSPSFAQVAGRQFAVYPAAAGHPELFAVEYFMTNRTYVCSILYRKHIFEVFRNDESLRYNEDSDFLQRVAISFKAAYLNSPTALVHYHNANKSSNRVEINRAMLKSVESILSAYPAFRDRLARLADQRVAGIVTELAAELIMEKRFADATSLGARYRLGFLEKLSILLKTPYLVQFLRKSKLLVGMICGIFARGRHGEGFEKSPGAPGEIQG